MNDCDIFVSSLLNHVVWLLDCPNALILFSELLILFVLDMVHLSSHFSSNFLATSYIQLMFFSVNCKMFWVEFFFIWFLVFDIQALKV